MQARRQILYQSLMGLGDDCLFANNTTDASIRSEQHSKFVALCENWYNDGLRWSKKDALSFKFCTTFYLAGEIFSTSASHRRYNKNMHGTSIKDIRVGLKLT